MLKKELIEFQKIKGYLPKIYLIHLSPEFENEIKNEIKGVAEELKHPIKIANEGERVII
jgi:hypothetical protein